MLKNLLLDKWSKNQMAHFFILRGPDDELKSWTTDFMAQVIENDQGINLSAAKESLEHGIPDLLEIKKEKGKQSYSWSKVHNDFAEFFKFIQFNPINLKRKVVILHDAHLLTQDICNKILRTLEEINSTTIFFLNPTESPMLKTIESRAITLRPISKAPESDRNIFFARNNFSDWINDYLERQAEGYLTPKALKHLIAHMELKEGPLDTIEALKNDKDTQKNLFELLVSWESQHRSSFSHKQAFLLETLRFKESQVYNNPYRERFFGLLTLCSQNTL